ncbi:MAG: DUF4136 domain-containing protein [Planctomycetota bacterium]
MPLLSPGRWPSWLLLGASLVLASCSAVTTSSDGDIGADLAHHRTFAWTVAPPVGLSGSAVADGPFDQRFERALQQTLRDKGWRQVALRDADVLFAQHLSVEVEIEQGDPFFDHYPARKVEHGTLTVDVLHPASRRQLWRGSARKRLRTTARGAGALVQRFEPTDEERRWPVDDLVETVLAPLPAHDAR